MYRGKLHRFLPPLPSSLPAFSPSLGSRTTGRLQFMHTTYRPTLDRREEGGRKEDGRREERGWKEGGKREEGGWKEESSASLTM